MGDSWQRDSVTSDRDGIGNWGLRIGDRGSGIEEIITLHSSPLPLPASRLPPHASRLTPRPSPLPEWFIIARFLDPTVVFNTIISTSSRDWLAGRHDSL